MDIDNDGFVQFVVAADVNQLEYVLIGGMALILNGGIRYTEDVDVWMEPTNENRDRLLNTLLSLSFTEDEIKGLRGGDFTLPQIIRLEENIDILTSVHHRFIYSECRKRARSFKMPSGQTIYFLHINDLRETKILARRPKDLNDILMIDEIIDAVKKQGQSPD